MRLFVSSFPLWLKRVKSCKPLCYGNNILVVAGRYETPRCLHVSQSVNSSSSFPIKDSDIEEYQKNGAIVLRDVFDSNWVDKVRIGIQKSLDSPSIYSDVLKDANGSGLFFNDYCKWDRITEFKDFVFNSSAAEIAARVTKSKRAIFFHDHVFVKEGGTQRGTPWHQDQPYYGIDGFQNCSIWMPVTFVKKESSLQFLKGSHLFDKSFIPRKFSTLKDYAMDKIGSKQFVSLQEDAIKEDQILSWDMKPGDCLVFHMGTLHGTSNAVSETTRMVLVTRWLGDDCIVADRPWTTSPPMEAFHCELKPGVPVSEAGPFPVIWEDTHS